MEEFQKNSFLATQYAHAFSDVQRQVQIANDVFRPVLAAQELLQKQFEPYFRIQQELRDQALAVQKFVNDFNENGAFAQIQRMAKQYAEAHKMYGNIWPEYVRSTATDDAAKDDTKDTSAIQVLDIVPAHVPTTVEILFAEVGVQYTKQNEHGLKRRKFCLYKMHLYDKEDRSVKLQLSAKKCNLLRAMRKRAKSTDFLTSKADYKNAVTTRGAIGELNKMGMIKLGLNSCLVVSDDYGGYRLAKNINIKI